MRISVIIPAAGIGKRMGGAIPKQFLELNKKPLVCHTLDYFRRFEELVLVTESERVEEVREDLVKQYDYPRTWKVVAGGKERQDSVRNGLNELNLDTEIVMIHDGVRPFIRGHYLDDVLRFAAEHGAAIVAAKMKDTVKRVDENGKIFQTEDRNFLWRAQTPQAFRYDVLKEAFAKADQDGFYGTDEASLVERIGHKVEVVEGDDSNIKITTPEDLALAEFLITKRLT